MRLCARRPASAAAPAARKPLPAQQRAAAPAARPAAVTRPAAALVTPRPAAHSAAKPTVRPGGGGAAAAAVLQRVQVKQEPAAQQQQAEQGQEDADAGGDMDVGGFDDGGDWEQGAAAGGSEEGGAAAMDLEGGPGVAPQALAGRQIKQEERTPAGHGSQAAQQQQQHEVRGLPGVVGGVCCSGLVLVHCRFHPLGLPTGLGRGATRHSRGWAARPCRAPACMQTGCFAQGRSRLSRHRHLSTTRMQC